MSVLRKPQDILSQTRSSFIYYLKSILSINDIQTLLQPLKERFHVSDDELNLSKIYETAYELQTEELEPVIEDLKKKYQRSLETFDDANLNDEEKKRMQLFSFITLLSYDVYVKKLLIEKMLDNTEIKLLIKWGKNFNNKFFSKYL